MTRKQVDPNEKPQEITKLAIGKPGGVDAEQDKFDTNTRVYCIPCNKTFDSANEKVGAMVTSILIANSAFNEDQVKEWE